MDQFARLLPYVWRNRSKVCLSIFFAVLVAALWAVTLSFTFLIVKVLLQGQSLDAYLAAEINESAARISHREQTLHDLEQDLEKLHSQESAVGTERGAQQRLITLRSCFGFIQSAIGTERGAQLQRSEDEIKRDQDHERRKLIAASQRLVALRWVQTYFMSWLPRDQFDTYALILGVLVLITVLKGTAMFIQELLVSSVVELSVLALRKDCFRHALELDYQTLSLRGSSELMSRFTNDIGIAADGLNLLGGKIVREPLKALACIAAAFYVNWQLTLLSLVFVPLMAAVFHRYGQLLKRASHHMMERMSRIYKSLEETFDGLKIVIAFNGARRHRQRFHRENKEYYQKAMQVARIDALTSPTTELLGVFAVCVSLLPGAYLVLRHTDTIWGIKLTAETMEIGNLSLLYAYLAGVLDPVRKLSSVYAKLKRAAAATERVFEMMAWQPLLKQTEKAQTLPRHAQSICFKKVSFKYVSTADGIDRPPALNDVTLKVAAGEVIVVVGENGSGKSTLVNLLPRYYDPDLGAVLIDGIDIRNVRLRDLRSQIGVVTQETLLFDDTIFENIRYGKPDATHTEIVAAATKAHVLQLFDLLPEGFDTVVGPRGARLSGGQRQRVALARALLRDPSILILDEATSAVDAQSESMIHQCLGDFVKGRTVFLITHSVTPRLLEFATRIVVLEQGRLVATGSHDELLQSCAAYQRLYRAQTTGHVDDSCVDLPLEENSVKELTSDISAAGEIPLLIKFAPNATPEQTSHTAFDNSQHRDPRRKAN